MILSAYLLKYKLFAQVKVMLQIDTANTALTPGTTITIKNGSKTVTLPMTTVISKLQEIAAGVEEEQRLNTQPTFALITITLTQTTVPCASKGSVLIIDNICAQILIATRAQVTKERILMTKQNAIGLIIALFSGIWSRGQVAMTVRCIKFTTRQRIKTISVLIALAILIMLETPLTIMT